MYKRILVPLDGSSTSGLALAHARELAAALGASLHLLRVVRTLEEAAVTATPSTVAQAAMSQDVVSRLDAEREAGEARTYLDHTAKDLTAAGIRAEAYVREGAPAEKLLDAARSLGADLIVMTAFGAGGAHTRRGEAVFGGVADQVLRESRVPVLLVRP